MRFIELHGRWKCHGWTLEQDVYEREMLEAIHATFPVRDAGRAGAAHPAVDYEFLDGFRKSRHHWFSDGTLLQQLHPDPPHSRRQAGDLPSLPKPVSMSKPSCGEVPAMRT